ncbi:MAG: hypothetical protein KF878_31190 [Planctomycetes bacterium]|nr:hypothetical protein [Planctomycetota bacterium]
MPPIWRATAAEGAALGLAWALALLAAIAAGATALSTSPWSVAAVASCVRQALAVGGVYALLVHGGARVGVVWALLAGGAALEVTNALEVAAAAADLTFGLGAGYPQVHLPEGLDVGPVLRDVAKRWTSWRHPLDAAALGAGLFLATRARGRWWQGLGLILPLGVAFAIVVATYPAHRGLFDYTVRFTPARLAVLAVALPLLSRLARGLVDGLGEPAGAR